MVCVLMRSLFCATGNCRWKFQDIILLVFTCPFSYVEMISNLSTVGYHCQKQLFLLELNLDYFSSVRKSRLTFRSSVFWLLVCTRRNIWSSTPFSLSQLTSISFNLPPVVHWCWCMEWNTDSFFRFLSSLLFVGSVWLYLWTVHL